MAVIALQAITRAGEDPSPYAAAVGPDTVDGNDGRVFLHLKNTNAAARTVTVNSVAPCDQGFDHDIAVVIPANTGDVMIGPFPPERFGSQLSISYSAVAGLTIAAVRLPPI